MYQLFFLAMVNTKWTMGFGLTVTRNLGHLHSANLLLSLSIRQGAVVTNQKDYALCQKAVTPETDAQPFRSH